MWYLSQKYINGCRTNISCFKNEEDRQEGIISDAVLKNLSAISRYDRTGVIKMYISTPSGTDTNIAAEVISRITDVLNPKMFFEENNCICFSYFLEQNKPFIDSAIETVKKIFEALGINDEENHNLSDFIINQITMVKVRKKWISYSDYLRHKNGLPQICTLREFEPTADEFLTKVGYQASLGYINRKEAV